MWFAGEGREGKEGKRGGEFAYQTDGVRAKHIERL